MTKQQVLIRILKASKFFGLFTVARYLTRRDLRILAYHGGSLHDEHLFRGGLFMSSSVFAQRMQHLKTAGYPIVSLEDAKANLPTGRLPDCATVITIDDGWFSTLETLAPVLKKHDFCSTLYVSTYYMEKQTRVFNVAASYILWKCQKPKIVFSEIHPSVPGSVLLDSQANINVAVATLSKFADGLDTAQKREELLSKLHDWSEIKSKEVIESRAMKYMNSDEIGSLIDYGMDVQLHTHRHTLPKDNYLSVENEIEENRYRLKETTENRLEHFCYPSGIYESEQIPWLEKLGIKTATTVTPGFNKKNQHLLELRRFIDWDHFSMLEFEAEMSGFFELIRRTGFQI